MLCPTCHKDMRELKTFGRINTFMCDDCKIQKINPERLSHADKANFPKLSDGML